MSWVIYAPPCWLVVQCLLKQRPCSSITGYFLWLSGSHDDLKDCEMGWLFLRVLGPLQKENQHVQVFKLEVRVLRRNREPLEGPPLCTHPPQICFSCRPRAELAENQTTYLIVRDAELQPTVNSKLWPFSHVKFKVLFGKDWNPKARYRDIWMDSDEADTCETLRHFDPSFPVEATCHLCLRRPGFYCLKPLSESHVGKLPCKVDPPSPTPNQPHLMAQHAPENKWKVYTGGNSLYFKRFARVC